MNSKELSKEEVLKTKEQILEDYGCPSIPFDENVTMYYPAILSAMDEWAEIKSASEVSRVMGELVGWMEEQRLPHNPKSHVYSTLSHCIKKLESLLKQEVE